METGSTPGRRRIARPLGIYIITVFDGIAIGLFPLILLIFLDNDPSIKISEFDYYLSAVLRIIVVAAALGAMMGEEIGRRILLGAVTAVSISMILNTINYLSSRQEASPQSVGLVGNITRGIFWVIINWWYFNRKGVIEYYRQNKEANKQGPV
jgi:hypothetical protein